MTKENCKGTPDQIQEIFKRGLTNKLMLDKIRLFNSAGTRLSNRFTVCVSPSVHKDTNRCAFMNDKDECELFNSGLKLYTCHKNVDVLPKLKHLSKEWMKAAGTATIKFFTQMMMP